MTDIQIWQPQAAEIAAYEPPSGPLDDWIRVADQVVRLANVIAESPFVPNGLRGSVPATAAAILTGRELGVPPMTALANIHVIGGKPGLSALVMRALILSKGHEWQDVRVSDTAVTVRGRRRGETEWTEATFTADQATRAKIMLGGYPQDKLYARATARLARRKFADVIAGMPYSQEELEDGILPDDDEPTNVGATAPGSNGTGTSVGSKPRTAQRRQRTPNSSPAERIPQGAAPAAPAPAGEDHLPPLPGEEGTPPGTADDAAPGEPDETTYDTEGTVTPAQLTAIWTVLSKVFAFGSDEKEQARAVCAHIVDHDLATSNNLSKNEAKTVLDTLAHWQQQAKDKGDEPRDYLIAVMVAEEAASDGE